MNTQKFKKAVVLLIMLAGSASAQYSTLWGDHGEKWDKARLPDFTNAGYKKGRAPFPQFPISVNVKTLGAKGDGVSDDRPYIQKAIRQCAANGTVFFPNGTYVINDSLLIGKSDIALKGESRDGTVLFITKGLEELYPKYNGKQSSWSWEGAMVLFNGGISNVGIENLTVRFPDSIYAGHNFHERGYNGIGFAAGVTDGWLRNITIINADLGIYLRDAHQVSCVNWMLTFKGIRETETIPTGPETGQSVSGHHGVNCYADHNLFHNFVYTRNYFHHLSVEPPAAPGLAAYNVFSQGKLPDARFDHHTSALRRTDHNLWTDLDAGVGSDIYNSSGAIGPLRVFLEETFWNIQGQKSSGNDPDASSENNNFVGVDRENQRMAPPLGKNPFVERIPTDQILPQNLYWAQMKAFYNIDASIVDSIPITSGINRPFHAGTLGQDIPFSIYQKGTRILVSNPNRHALRLEIFDLQGRMIFSASLPQGSADLEINPDQYALKKGLYLVKAHADGFAGASDPSPLLLN